jgi:hypothetical protein
MLAWAERRILRNSPNVFMCVSSFNPDALRLYRRLGYEIVGTLKGFVVDEHDEFLLQKRAGSWEAFRAGLLAYLSRQDDWLLENHWPIECILKYPDKYASGAPQNVRYAASGNAQPAHRPLGAPTHHHAPAERATGLPGPNPGMPLAALEWNRVVTAGPPVENWTHRDRGLAVEDPDFLAALPKILPLCQQAFESQPDEVEWLNFRYLLRKGKGEVENWYRMANGEFNWLRKKRGQNRKAAGEASVDNLLGMVNERLAELESTELTQPAGHAS